MRTILYAMALLLLPGLLVAQRNISGVVTDADTGETLIGANILVEGTTTGTITDIDGSYQLSVPADAKALVFSYTGYANQVIEIGAQSVINVQMASGELLDEVVVIGYGTVKREDATGSVQTVDSELFNKGAITSTQELIAGKVAGVSITPAADPGGGATIRIRGGASLAASNDPLIVIDGVPIANDVVAGARNPLNLVNPNDIENVTVLKDASATAIYGSRASNGVIIITTKKGKSGGIKLSLNTNVGVSTIQDTYDVFSADEFRGFVQENFPANADLLGDANTDWQDQIYQTGIAQEYNLSASGGIKDFLPYRVSVGYNNRTGIIKRDQFERLTYGVSLTPSFLDNRLQINANFRGMNIDNQFANRGAIGAAISFDPTQPIFDSESPYGGYFTFVNNDGIPNNLAPANPLAQIMLKDDQSTVNRFIGNLSADYRFGFLPELRANINVGYDQANGSGGVLETEEFSAVFIEGPRGGTMNTYEQTITNELFDFYLNYVKQFDKIKVDLMAGYGYQHFKFEKDELKSDLNMTEGNVERIIEAGEYYLISLFSRLNLNIGDRILLTGTVRRDGTSRFSEKNRYGIFPAAAVGYKFVSNDNPRGILNNFKLRVGWGITGQQDLNDNYYPYLATYTISQDDAQNQFGNEFVNTQRPNGYNEDLKWEETTTYNAAIDFGLFNDRISGTFELYQRDTDDLLAAIRPAAGTNLTNRLDANFASLTNRGMEVTLNLTPVQTSRTNWTISLNANRNINEITQLSNDPSGDTFVEDGGIAGGVGNTVQRSTVGLPARTFFLYEQVYDENGQPISGLYVDQNADGVITPDGDLRAINQPAPEWFAGITSNLSIGKFDFSFAGRANLGNYVYNNPRAQYTDLTGTIASTGFASNRLRAINQIGLNNAQFFSDVHLENGSFFRLDHATIGYRFDEVFGETRGGNLRLYATVQNPFIITEYNGIDPEVFGGIDNDVYPRSRTFLFGANLNF
ncbi:MAG: SusC/RagA family TonB-linked outer membrane protein [Bacteroidota bacterium]